MVVISALSMVVSPFWITVTLAFLTTLPCSTNGFVEGDVVGLPLERWLAGVHGRYNLLVNCATVVVLELEPVRVEDLELVDAAEEDAAVAATLTARFRHVRDVEFEMEVEGCQTAFGS